MIVIPPKSDAIRPFHVIDKRYKPDDNRKMFLLKFLGNPIYKLRQKKHDSNVKAVLRSLPRGYHFQYKKGTYTILGHPSKLRFYSAAAFLPHLLWLESISESQKRNKPNEVCICCICKKVRKAVSQDDKPAIENPIPSTALLHSKKISLSPTTKKLPSLNTNTKKSAMKSTSPVANDSTPTSTELSKSPSNTPETILLYPITKILIESPDITEYCPPNFTIPLPKLKKGDESILLNSRKE